MATEQELIDLFNSGKFEEVNKALTDLGYSQTDIDNAIATAGSKVDSSKVESYYHQDDPAIPEQPTPEVVASNTTDTPITLSEIEVALSDGNFEKIGYLFTNSEDARQAAFDAYPNGIPDNIKTQLADFYSYLDSGKISSSSPNSLDSNEKIVDAIKTTVFNAKVNYDSDGRPILSELDSAFSNLTLQLKSLGLTDIAQIAYIIDGLGLWQSDSFKSDPNAVSEQLDIIKTGKSFTGGLPPGYANKSGNAELYFKWLEDKGIKSGQTGDWNLSTAIKSNGSSITSTTTGNKTNFGPYTDNGNGTHTDNATGVTKDNITGESINSASETNKTLAAAFSSTKDSSPVAAFNMKSDKHLGELVNGVYKRLLHEGDLDIINQKIDEINRKLNTDISKIPVGGTINGAKPSIAPVVQDEKSICEATYDNTLKKAASQFVIIPTIDLDNNTVVETFKDFTNKYTIGFYIKSTPFDNIEDYFFRNINGYSTTGDYGLSYYNKIYSKLKLSIKLEREYILDATNINISVNGGKLYYDQKDTQSFFQYDSFENYKQSHFKNYDPTLERPDSKGTFDSVGNNLYFNPSSEKTKTGTPLYYYTTDNINSLSGFSETDKEWIDSYLKQHKFQHSEIIDLVTTYQQSLVDSNIFKVYINGYIRPSYFNTPEQTIAQLVVDITPVSTKSEKAYIPETIWDEEIKKTYISEGIKYLNNKIEVYKAKVRTNFSDSYVDPAKDILKACKTKADNTTNLVNYNKGTPGYTLTTPGGIQTSTADPKPGEAGTSWPNYYETVYSTDIIVQKKNSGSYVNESSVLFNTAITNYFAANSCISCAIYFSGKTYHQNILDDFKARKIALVYLPDRPDKTYVIKMDSAAASSYYNFNISERTYNILKNASSNSLELSEVIEIKDANTIIFKATYPEPWWILNKSTSESNVQTYKNLVLLAKQNKYLVDLIVSRTGTINNNFIKSTYRKFEWDIIAYYNLAQQKEWTLYKLFSGDTKESALPAGTIKKETIDNLNFGLNGIKKYAIYPNTKLIIDYISAADKVYINTTDKINQLDEDPNNLFYISTNSELIKIVSDKTSIHDIAFNTFYELLVDKTNNIGIDTNSLFKYSYKCSIEELQLIIKNSVVATEFYKCEVYKNRYLSSTNMFEVKQFGDFNSFTKTDVSGNYTRETGLIKNIFFPDIGIADLVDPTNRQEFIVNVSIVNTPVRYYIKATNKTSDLQNITYNDLITNINNIQRTNATRKAVSASKLTEMYNSTGAVLSIPSYKNYILIDKDFTPTEFKAELSSLNLLYNANLHNKLNLSNLKDIKDSNILSDSKFNFFIGDSVNIGYYPRFVYRISDTETKLYTEIESLNIMKDIIKFVFPNVAW